MSLRTHFFCLYICLLAMLVALWSCHDAGGVMSNDVIVQNDEFTVTVDSVIEGGYVAAATSDRQIVTNFEWDTEPQAVPEAIDFRLALNGGDNELAAGKVHRLRHGQDTTFCFGDGTDVAVMPETDTLKAVNAATFEVKVDMTPVFDSFKKLGYYVGARGDTTFSKDFDGVWIAGSRQPLTDDFRNLRNERRYRLQPTGSHNVYALRLEVKRASAKAVKCHGWSIGRLNDDFPQYHSEQLIADALYNMAIDDISGGVKHGRLDARESYLPIYLSLAYLAPEYSKTLLKAGVEGDSLLRGDGWPIVSSHALWVLAAWEVYSVTGDKDWLQYAFGVAGKTLAADLHVMLDRQTGLLRCALGRDADLGIKTLYPQWMGAADLFETASLANNVAYQTAFDILGQMADALGKDYGEYADTAAKLKEAINQRFWDENAGLYRGAAYCRAGSVMLPVTDNFAQAMSVLFDIADDDRAETLVGKTPISHYGVPMMFPGMRLPDAGQLADAQLQALWNMASARVGNENMLRRGLGAMWRAAALFGGNKRHYGCYEGGTPGEAGKLHDVAAAAGSAAMMFRVIAGMNFLPGGIEFDPVVPDCLKGMKRISGFKYRRCTLDISIEGTGNDIGEMLVDEQPATDNFVPDTLTGRHTVKIVMARSGRSSQNVTVTSKPRLLPASPLVAWNGENGRIVNYGSDNGYRIVVNGTQNYSVVDSIFAAPFSRGLNVATMVSVSKKGVSQISRPYVYDMGMRRFGIAMAAAEDSGGGKTAEVVLNVKASGRYYADIVYSNGTGNAWCTPGCMVEVAANTHFQGIVVMPSLGEGVWRKRGQSSMVELDLVKGDNVVTLRRLATTAAGNGSAAMMWELRLFGR